MCGSDGRVTAYYVHVSSCPSGTVTTSSSPSHKITCQRTKTQKETKESQGSGIAKGLSEVSFDRILWTKVDFLKQF